LAMSPWLSQSSMIQAARCSHCLIFYMPLHYINQPLSLSTDLSDIYDSGGCQFSIPNPLPLRVILVTQLPFWDTGVHGKPSFFAADIQAMCHQLTYKQCVISAEAISNRR
jgi:hypothetical protein